MIGPKAYIHLSRLEQNIANIQRAVGDRTLMVVVKANGYGLGLSQLTHPKHLKGIDYFGVNLSSQTFTDCLNLVASDRKVYARRFMACVIHGYQVGNIA